MNLKTMVKQVKCVKNKIAKKVFEKKMIKVPTNMNYFNYSSTNSFRKRRNSEYLTFENIGQKLNISQITNKFNISGIKKTLLKLVDLDDCFEGEEEKYGFRTKVTLLQNSPCVLNSTCRGEPELELELQTETTTTTGSSSIQNEVDNDDLTQNYFDNLERRKFGFFNVLFWLHLYGCTYLIERFIKEQEKHILLSLYRM